jgi:hypothetical protein
VLALHVNNVKSIALFSQQNAALFMDSVGIHMSSNILPFLQENLVAVIVFLSFATRHFQNVRISFFRILQTLEKTAHGNFSDECMNNQATKFIHAYE